MTSSRLPTLLEEETPDVKSSGSVPPVREEADGKDDTAEVLKKYIYIIHKHTARACLSSSCSVPPGPGELQPVSAAVVPGHHQQLPGGEGHQLQHVLEERPGLLRPPASLPPREDVRQRSLLL